MENSVDPMFTVLAKTDHEAAEREIKEYVSFIPISIQHFQEDVVLRTRVPTHTGRRLDHTRRSLRGRANHDSTFSINCLP